MNRMILADMMFAAIGLYSQWIGAHYARLHGLNSWHFGFVPFVASLLTVFILIAIRPFQTSPSIRFRIVISSLFLWLLCGFAALGLWISIYGS